MSLYAQPQLPVSLPLVVPEKEKIEAVAAPPPPAEFVPVHLERTLHSDPDAQHRRLSTHFSSRLTRRPTSEPIPLRRAAAKPFPAPNLSESPEPSSSTAVNRNSAPELPFSVWKRIAGNLDDKEVWNLRSLNRNFSNIAKAAKFHTLTIGFDPRHVEEGESNALKVVRQLRDPRLAGLVREVVVDIRHGASSTLGVSPPPPPSTSTESVSSRRRSSGARLGRAVSRLVHPIKRIEAHAHERRNRDALFDVLGTLTNIQTVQIHGDPTPPRDVQEIRTVSNRVKSMLNALWVASGSIIRHVAVDATLQTINVIPLDTLFLSNLKQISIKISSSEEDERLKRSNGAASCTDVVDLFKDAINTNITPFIQNHFRQLTSLTINLGPSPRGSSVTTSTFIHDLRPLPGLQFFSIAIYSEDDGLMIHHFLGLHRGTLKRVELELQNDAINALTAPVQTFEFPYPALSHVHNIALRLASPRTGPLGDALEKYISNYASNLFSFRLINAFLTWEGFEQLVECFPAEKCRMRHLYIDVSSLSVGYLLLLRQRFPNLEDLHIRFANLAVPFFEGMQHFPDWQLPKLILQMVPLRNDRVIRESRPGECRTKIIAATDHIEATATAIQQRFPGIRDFSVVMPKGKAK